MFFIFIQLVNRTDSIKEDKHFLLAYGCIKGFSQTSA